MADTLEVTRSRVLSEVMVTFDPNGILCGGHAIWWDVLRADAGDVIHAGQTLAEPIAGALQPGTPFAEMLTGLDAQLRDTVLSQAARIGELEAQLDALAGRA